ncbi:MAG: hypothetical protein AAF196_06120 [Planctomycetota bacterium]
MSGRACEIANEIASAGELLNPTAWFKTACKRIAELEAEVKTLRGGEYSVGYVRGARDESAESAKLSAALADQVAELEAAQPRWIPVGERLPTGSESLQGLLVVSQGSKPREAWFDEDMGWTNGDCIPLDGVMLWMTIPEGPE